MDPRLPRRDAHHKTNNRVAPVHNIKETAGKDGTGRDISMLALAAEVPARSEMIGEKAVSGDDSDETILCVS
ncbi:UNVERIFIED_CONTAM: hypothetical protein FKN15_025458 [Acipenser sinensis]